MQKNYLIHMYTNTMPQNQQIGGTKIKLLFRYNVTIDRQHDEILNLHLVLRFYN